MMADSSQLPQTARDAMILLPDVWNILIDPSKKVVDDTCLEKLLSWMVELADSPATLKNLLDETSVILGFLQKSLNPDCNSTTQVFALRLSAILLNSLNGISVKTQLPYHLPKEKQGFQAGKKSGFNRNSDDLQCKYIGVIIDLVDEHLTGSFKSASWQKASIRTAWFESARALVGCKCPSDIIQRQGILDITFQSLEDNCLFVISAAQQFLADLITAMYTCSNRLPSSLDSMMQSTDTNTSCQHNLEMSNSQQAALARDYTEEYQEPLCKRSRLDHGDDKPIKKPICDCQSYLKTCLKRMTDIMTPVKPVQPRLGTNNCLIKLRTAIMGVWIRLLESQPLIAQAILTDISIVAIISELLQHRSHTSFDMCTTIAEFMSLFLQALHDRNACSDIHVGSKLVAVMIGLPVKLMNIHHFKASIQLASDLYSNTQLSKVKGQSSQFQLSNEDGASLLRLVMLPVDCLHIPSECHPTIPGSSSLFSIYKEYLLKEMMQHKCQCLTLLCHSLSAMQRLIDRGLYHVISQHTNLVDQTTYILSLTLGHRSHQVITDSLMRCHLRGSIKVTKAALGVAMTTVASTTEDACNSKLPEASLMTLFLQLIAVLKNPESDPTVVSKCFDVLGLLLPTCFVKLKHTELTITLAETVTKRMCDPQWAVRDSVISFLQRLLRSPTDELCSWFKCHRLHVRILECIQDGESFVRATAMNALVDISKQEDLWKDLLQTTGKSEIVLVGEFINFLLDDSPGFLRRATVNTYTQWLKVFPWLETGLPGRLQGSTDEACVRMPQSKDNKLANRNATEFAEESSVASQIRSAVSTAMFDLDWEVKHGALIFWQTLLEMCTPVRINTTSDANEREETDQEKLQNSEGKDLCEVTKGTDDQPAKPMFEFLQFLKEEVLIGKLVAVLEDEDPTVARRACQMLLNLYNCLPKEMTVDKMDASDMVTFMKKMQGELEMLNLKELLDEKTKLMDTNGKNPLSLLQDILTGTEENDCKFLDCY
ncbi:uncharacterized protein LOC119745327 [Patiria miniata]|uniref:Uncharacterized protein n=1 Tax=Patiria miniata TaxID=46514 RepID=A0A914BMM6_PATMI|nr:uncharacterized protein LOC119734795 [Patiria miniata]XP_038077543.1 uncharacterized protein LOC119745327 [Patiria miniata]